MTGGGTCFQQREPSKDLPDKGNLVKIPRGSEGNHCASEDTSQHGEQEYSLRPRRRLGRPKAAREGKGYCEQPLRAPEGDPEDQGDPAGQ